MSYGKKNKNWATRNGAAFSGSFATLNDPSLVCWKDGGKRDWGPPGRHLGRMADQDSGMRGGSAFDLYGPCKLGTANEKSVYGKIRGAEVHSPFDPINSKADLAATGIRVHLFRTQPRLLPMCRMGIRDATDGNHTLELDGGSDGAREKKNGRVGRRERPCISEGRKVVAGGTERSISAQQPFL